MLTYHKLLSYYSMDELAMKQTLLNLQQIYEKLGLHFDEREARKLLNEIEEHIRELAVQVDAYLASFSDIEKMALEIAQRELGSSFDIEKTNGFIEFKRQNNLKEINIGKMLDALYNPKAEEKKRVKRPDIFKMLAEFCDDE